MSVCTGKTGELFVVATPIGNMGDITLRGIEVLHSVNLIAAEDTRHSGKLLQKHGVTTPVVSYHEHNEYERSRQLVTQLAQGDRIALISDAGTPLISDPGYRLVCAALDAGIKVTPVPGPCAGIAALSVSGLPTDRFVFEGFLPAKPAARGRRLTELSHESRTLVIYESSHRALACLQDMRDSFGPGRMITVAREITKHYETLKRDTLTSCLEWMKANPEQQQGEVVFVVEGRDKQPLAMQSAESVLVCLLADLPLKRAAALAAQITGRPKNELYALGLSLRETTDD